ncbi:MAG: isoprenylcysteine carboxylmethyltransferase family protein [bacterium]
MDKPNAQQTVKARIKLILKTIIHILLMFLFIFLPAGRITYWQGWVFFGINLITIILLLITRARDPEFNDLIKERMKPGPGAKWWDKIFRASYIPVAVGTIICASLDGGRFSYTMNIPIIVYFIAIIGLIVGTMIIAWAMKVNRFFSSTVRIQTDRGHQVIQEGPYRYVRHPGYIGMIIWWLSAPIILNSYRALILGATLCLLLIIRTYPEDKTLQTELPGYKEYTQKVKYRLFPKVW